MVNSISQYSVSSALSKRNGWSGLVSGMDTDSMIETMMQASNQRLSALYQKQQKITWKTQAYRSITSSLMEFQSKYLSSTAASSLFSSTFFENAAITSQGTNASAVTVTGALSGIQNLQVGSVSQLAQTESLTTDLGSGSQHAILSDTFLDADGNFIKSKTYSTLEDQSINLRINGSRVDITLKNVKVEAYKEYQAGDDGNIDYSSAENQAIADENKAIAQRNAEGITSAFNDAIKKAGYGDKMNAELTSDGKIHLNLTGDGLGTVEVMGGGKVLLDLTGIKTGSTAKKGDALKGNTSLTQYDAGSEPSTNASVGIQDMKGKSLTFDLDGVKRVITFDGEVTTADGSSLKFEDVDTKEELEAFLKAKIQDAYEGKVSVELKDTGQLEFKTTEETSILSVATGDGSVIGSRGYLGLNLGDANRLLRYDPITETNLNLGAQADAIKASMRTGDGQEIKINGSTFTVFDNRIEVSIDGGEAKTYHFESGTTVANLMDTVNNAKIGVTMKYNSTSDNFTITATESGSLGKVEIDTSDTSGKHELTKALFGDLTQATQISGTDAQATVSLDGGNTWIHVTRSSNSFTLDGMNITLNKKFGEVDADGKPVSDDQVVTFSGKMNTDEIVKGITDMVDAYNALVKSVNNQVSQRPDKDYQPLTTEQKKELSEDEIKNYEEKAKGGILFGDSLLKGLATDIRFAFSLPVNGEMLSSIGITTSSNWEDNGLISVNENELREAIEKDPEKVKALFTADTNGTVSSSNTDAGVMTRLKSVMDKYVSTTGDKGLLISRAGHESYAISLTDNAMYREAKAMDDKINKMIESIEKEMDRYYNQFSSLEMYINQMNMQSSWLSQQFTS